MKVPCCRVKIGLICLCFLMNFICGLTVAYAQNMSPILPLPMSMKKLPLLDGAFRDPVVVNAAISSPGEAERLLQNISESKSDQTRSKGTRRSELLSQEFEAYAVLEAYLADAAAGKFSEDGGGRPTQSLSEVRRQLISLARTYAKGASSAKEKARGEFYVAIMNYLQGSNRAGAVASLKKLVQGKDLSPALKNRAHLAISIYALEAGNMTAAREAAQKIQSMGRNIPNDGFIAGRLAMAKRFARDKGKGYRQYLSAASSSTARLGVKQKEEVLSFSIAVWRSAEGKGGWSNPPFLLKAFQGFEAIYAIEERAALDDWRAKKESVAIKKMSKLARNFAGSPRMKIFDERVLDMNESLYRKNKEPTAYERALLSTREFYSDPTSLGSGNETMVEQMKQNIIKRYKKLVYQGLAAAKSPKATSKERRGAIALGVRYLEFTENAQEKEDVNANIAAIYALDKQHAKAVALYLDLAAQNASGKTKNYLELAITSQRVLADWPEKAPWEGVKSKGHTGEREKLRDIYQKLIDLNKDKVEWRYLSHTGLLDLQLGREDAAFEAWDKALRSSYAGGDASHAAGYMLTAYFKTKRWEKLEGISRFCREKRIVAIHMGKKIDVDQMFADALFYGGKEALAEKKFDIAIKKLEEFTKTFTKAKNRDEGFYLLSFAYYGGARYRDAIQTLVTLIETYPKTKFLRDASLTGGKWAIPMAFEENAIYFYEKFLKNFSSDAEALGVRDVLYDLYLGRALYAEAIQTAKSQAAAKNVSQEKRIQSLTRVMKVEEKHGVSQRAVQAANSLISASRSQAVQAMAYGVIGRAHVKTGNTAGLKSIESQLSKLSLESDEARESLSEVKLAIAELNAKGGFEEIHNLSLKDPLGTLNQRYHQYNEIIKQYERVCEVERAPYCAPALFRIARCSEEFIASLEEISIPPSLPEAEVNNFEKRKRDVIGFAVSKAEAMDNKSIAVVLEGYTEPEWTTAIMWQNASDWDSERVTGETGEVFVQWAF